jgi:hypothetical protein
MLTAVLMNLVMSQVDHYIGLDRLKTMGAKGVLGANNIKCQT